MQVEKEKEDQIAEQNRKKENRLRIYGLLNKINGNEDLKLPEDDSKLFKRKPKAKAHSRNHTDESKLFHTANSKLTTEFRRVSELRADPSPP